MRETLAALSDRVAAESSFDGTSPLAVRAVGFEAIVGVLSSNLLNHGVSRLMISEAAYLFGLIRELPTSLPQVVEIGRYRGGTTLLLAAAGASVVSIDVDPNVAQHDIALIEALEARSLEPRVTLVIGDSHDYGVEAATKDLVLIDGDHSYEGARADVEHWLPALVPEGHLLLHDAVRPEPFSPWSDPCHVDGVRRLCDELLGDSRLSFVGRAGTIAHFMTTQVS